MFILTDEKTADEDIIRINEKYYGISFPDCYKNVLKTLGEGHIGYLLMYSMDPNGEPYRWVAGHVPDTTWTNNPEPPEWADMIGRVNSSLGGQVNRYPIGYKPTFFVFVEG